MSWNDFYRRRDALAAAVRHASRHPEHTLSLTDIPAARDVFHDEGELLLALQHKWTQALTGRISLALQDLDSGAETDSVDAVSKAWRRTARDHAELRAILDAHAEAYTEVLRPGREMELRMLALASGLATSSESADTTTQVGAALLSLLCSTPAPPVKQRGPVAQLRRLLAATA